MKHRALLTLILTGAFLAPAVSLFASERSPVPQSYERRERAERRVCDREYRVYHVWNRAEDRAYRTWLRLEHHAYRSYERLRAHERRAYWRWRHEHPYDRDDYRR